MSFIFSFGAWGGFWGAASENSWRLCLGWMAITLLFKDFDYWLLEKLEIDSPDQI